MKALSKIALVTLALVVLIAAVAVFSPRVVHAVAAALVRDVDNAARHPFATTCSTPSMAMSTNGCSVPIPAGEEVVIETVSIQAYADPGNTKLLSSLGPTTSGTFYLLPLPPTDDAGIGQPTNSYFINFQSGQFYADPGISLWCYVETKNSNPAVGLFASCTFSGYYVTLP